MFIVQATELGAMTFRPIKVSTQEDNSLSGVYISDFLAKMHSNIQSDTYYLGYLGDETQIRSVPYVLCCPRQGTLTEGEGSIQSTSLY